MESIAKNKTSGVKRAVQTSKLKRTAQEPAGN